MKSQNETVNLSTIYRYMNSKVVTNTIWLFSDRAVRLFGGVISLSIIVRSLGPEAFGQASFVLAIVTLIASLATLGTTEILVRDIVRRPYYAPVLVRSAFQTAALGSLLLTFGLIIALYFLIPHGTSVHVAAIASTVVLFRSAQVFRAIFDANVDAKSYIKYELPTFITLAILKAMSILAIPTADMYLIVTTAEAFALSLAVFLAYKKTSTVSSNKSSLRYIRLLLARAWPTLLSAIAVTVYMKVDQLMIGYFLEPEQIAFYTVAVRTTEFLMAAPLLMLTSTYPFLVRRSSVGDEQLDKGYVQAGRILNFAAVGICIVAFVLSDKMIWVLYGSGYEDAVAVFSIYVWSLVLVASGTLGARWMIIKRMYRVNLIFTFSGAAINVALNWVLIPHYGILGAALATMISYSLVVFGFDGIVPQTRRLLKLKVLTFIPIKDL